MMFRNRLRPVDDLNTALRTVAEFNRVILAADTKTGLLLTANGFALTGLVTVTRRPMSTVLVMLAIGLAMSLIVCMGYLAATLRPRLGSACPGNWFCFPSFPIDVACRPTAPTLADQAWLQAGTLAEIARHKYRRFGVALRWTAISLVVFLAWFTATVLSAPS